MSAKIRPNDRCPCGSGLKYKKCCGGPNSGPFAKDIFDFNRLIAYEGPIGQRRREFCKMMQKYLEHHHRHVMAHSATTAKAAGKAITCASGCSYCCGQYISISLQEAEAIVFYLYNEGKDNLELFINVYKEWRPRTKQLELFDQLLHLGQAAITSDDPIIKKQYMDLADQYVKLNIPCPFLKESLCTIYPVRPKVCAGYAACSPPHYCDPTDDLKPDTFLSVFAGENVIPYFLNPDLLVYSNAPLLVYEILQNGYLYLSQLPTLNGLDERVFQNPTVTRILHRNKHLFKDML